MYTCGPTLLYIRYIYVRAYTHYLYVWRYIRTFACVRKTHFGGSLGGFTVSLRIARVRRKPLGKVIAPFLPGGHIQVPECMSCCLQCSTFMCMQVAGFVCRVLRRHWSHSRILRIVTVRYLTKLNEYKAKQTYIFSAASRVPATCFL